MMTCELEHGRLLRVVSVTRPGKSISGKVNEGDHFVRKFFSQLMRAIKKRHIAGAMFYYQIKTMLSLIYKFLMRPLDRKKTRLTSLPALMC